jgi:ArsR family transcriptional regulator, arsenate/arsenite/antimonite-responsive transcriptional repressor
MSRPRTPGICHERGMLWNERGLLLMAGDLIRIYQCFCDRTRLRILHLLAKSPLCVCHFQEILDEPQVKISKHLAYLRKRGMVVAKRDRNWMIYSIPVRRSRELETNLKCLQDCVQSDAVFGRDLKKLVRLRESCCEPASVFHKTKSQFRS